MANNAKWLSLLYVADQEWSKLLMEEAAHQQKLSENVNTQDSILTESSSEKTYIIPNKTQADISSSTGLPTHMPLQIVKVEPSDKDMDKNTPKTEDQKTPKVAKTQKRRKREITEDCMYRTLNNIDKPPTFIDGDGSVKQINTYNDDISVDTKGRKNPQKPRFGYPDQIDTVILGSNGTTVSKRELNLINWSAEPRVCLRHVLLAVFDRKVLAFSNLTGQGSNAFRGVDKPKKSVLDPNKVEDITEFILEQLPTTRKEVRQAIVAKCADETKNFFKQLKMEKEENVSLDMLIAEHCSENELNEPLAKKSKRST